MASVLIVDDDMEICSLLTDLVTSVDHHAEHAQTLNQGLARALTGEFDVVFLDVKMPDGSGLDIIREILDIEFPPEIIIITGQGDSDGAEMAIKNGAWDYLQKPLSPKKIIQPLNRILQYRDGIRSIAKPSQRLKREEIVGSSPQIQHCLNIVSKAANTSSNVLITGETGTGKELFARAIHNNSERNYHKFVVVDCAALPESLIESALFGHEKGSFTGADKTVKGLINLADGGTLFLDEVGEMNLNLQKAFLRVLQERKYRPVGGKNEVYSNFRVIAATNRNLDQMVLEKFFRKDLLYRLNAISIHLPPLRERIDDIQDLISHLTLQIYNSLDIETKEYSKEFITTLKRYNWPGNVRELVNILEASISDAFYEPVLFSKHLPEHIRIKMAKSPFLSPEKPINGNAGKKSAASEENLPTFRIIRETALAEAESSYLRTLMKATRGNIKQACTISELGRTRLYTLLKKYGIDRMGWK